MRLNYPILRRLGLGAHLAVVVALAAIPTSLLIIEFIESERREAIEDAEKWTQRAATLVAERRQHVIATTRTVLTATAAQLDASARSQSCATPPTGNGEIVWMIAPNGEILCSTTSGFPLSQSVIEELLEDIVDPGFAVMGPYLSGAGRAQLFGALTIRAADGTTWHVIRAIDLAWQPAYDEDLGGPADFVVMTIDDEGLIYHRLGPGADLPIAPDGKLRPAPPFHASTLVGTSTLMDIDGVPRIFGAASIPETGDTVMVGLSQDAVSSKAKRDLIADLALFAAALTLSGVLAWLTLERMVLRSLRRLRDAAVATASGEPSDRVEITDGPIELRELAHAFNDMKDKLEFQAFHDQLTGLGNRRYIEQRMAALLQDGEPFAILAVDLDGFKPINDTYGHAVGDFVLAEAANRLKAEFQDGLFIGRTGGDEFLAGIAVDGERPADMASQVATRVLEGLGRPITLPDGTQETISGSVGIAFWAGNGTTADDVIRQADAALYRAKRSGRNRFVSPDAPEPQAGCSSSKAIRIPS
ncbi:diguanylate cyclase domain-containing protein [Microbaculum marinisediminis]|uniref:Diguanylate cyclase n=1 Tax=Microbaculum marinisediminis TaxID=2931392 RepID=A0AAW5R4U7_9HYPH|nr:diguanylate cyclase [Microbaculum sp. A6E488]MCT8974157.1 diguanylate cyclase [Microbaculum sp. A6E488]